MNELELSGQGYMIQNSSTWTYIGSRLVQEDQVEISKLSKSRLVFPSMMINTSCSGGYLTFIPFLFWYFLPVKKIFMGNMAHPNYHRYNTSFNYLIYSSALSLFYTYSRWSTPERHTFAPSLWQKPKMRPHYPWRWTLLRYYKHRLNTYA